MARLINGNTSVESKTLLDVKHLSVDYLATSGAVHAVTDVSFTLARGEILGLAGESGCGKSTLAYAISRLLRPPAYTTGGEILYYPRYREDEAGKQLVSSSTLSREQKNRGVERETPSEEDMDAVDILSLSNKELRAFRWSELAMVFQSAMNALNPVLKIGTQLMDVLKVHRPQMGADSRKQRAIELLQLVGISADRINSYPHELSGGMRQRAMIAIALALTPELIIMDEPTTALDVVMQREILTEIIRLREKFAFSVIFITHDLSLLLELADRVAIMYAGRIVELASQRDLYQHPRHPYSYGLLNSFPSLHGPRQEAGGIPGSPPDLREAPPGCAFHPRCPMAFDACPKILPILRPATVESPEQQVACHLYDPALWVNGPPTNDDIARGYQSRRERSQVR